MAGTYKSIATNLDTYGRGIQDVLVADPSGNLYGEVGQNSQNGGIAFQLKAYSGFQISNVFYTFSPYYNGDPDGLDPSGGLTLDGAHFIGTTGFGGVYSGGTTFNLGKLSDINFTALHAFNPMQTKPTDGKYPASGLTAGPSNLYYGATDDGGLHQAGTVFYVSASTTAPLYKVIYRFRKNQGDGDEPTNGRLVFDAQGRLYGETFLGGAYGDGIVYMLQKVGSTWEEQILHSFGAGGDLGYPVGNVVIDTHGDVYGCTLGGQFDEGAIFQLVPPTETGGAWQETVIGTFGGKPGDPNVDGDARYGCGLTIDPSSGYILGTTPGGGARGYGALFSLTPPASGKLGWTQVVEHSFVPNYKQMDGTYPVAPPLKVGATYYGGTLSGSYFYAFTP